LVVLMGCTSPQETTPPVEDGRQLVQVSGAQRAVVKQVMRQNLETLNAVLEASGRQDLAQVRALAAAAAAAPGPGRVDPTLRPLLPDAWRAMGKDVHRGWGELAKLTSQPVPVHVVTAQVAQVTAACVACHKQYVIALP